MNGLLKGISLVALMLAAWTTEAAAQSASDYRELPNFQRVDEGLYRGAQPLAGGMERLAALGVRTVVNLRRDDERARAEGREAEAAGLRYFNIPLDPYRRPGDAVIDRVLSVIDDPAAQPVFVHCQRGSDRTGTVVALYRIRRQHWNASDALREAESHGMRWLAFEMKDYIADAYRRELQSAQAPLTNLHDSKTQLAGTAAAATRLAVEKSYRYSRRSLKHLSKMIH
jgi:tyrosine-protein phosphatase SIW14